MGILWFVVMALLLPMGVALVCLYLPDFQGYSLSVKILDVIQSKAPVTAKRSGSWPALRKHHLETHPTCAICGGTKFLEVHHIEPFHSKPELELLDSNLITLCEHPFFNDHLRYGHLGNYKCINVDVLKDAVIWHKKLANRVEANNKHKLTCYLNVDDIPASQKHCDCGLFKSKTESK